MAHPADRWVAVRAVLLEIKARATYVRSQVDPNLQSTWAGG